jgi:hypothetical protein
MTTMDAHWSNLAPWDRALRVGFGLALLALGFYGSGEGLSVTLLRIFGWLPLVTGVAGWCPFYALIGVRSRR